MDNNVLFETVEGLLLDCPRCKIRIINHDTGEEFEAIECYEANWELVISIQQNTELKEKIQ